MNELQAQIATLDNASLAELEGFIKEQRGARIAARNAALPEFPNLIAVDGHQTPIQVNREKAVELLATGQYKLAE